MMDVRCPKCNKLLGRSDGQGAVEIQCPRCNLLVRGAPTYAVQIVAREPRPSQFRVLGKHEDRTLRPDETK